MIALVQKFESYRILCGTSTVLYRNGHVTFVPRRRPSGLYRDFRTVSVRIPPVHVICSSAQFLVQLEFFCTVDFWVFFERL